MVAPRTPAGPRITHETACRMRWTCAVDRAHYLIRRMQATVDVWAQMATESGDVAVAAVEAELILRRIRRLAQQLAKFPLLARTLERVERDFAARGKNAAQAPLPPLA